MTPKSITKRIQVQQIAKLEKRIEELITALQVIYTWAAVDRDTKAYSGRALHPGHIMDLIDRTLNE